METDLVERCGSIGGKKYVCALIETREIPEYPFCAWLNTSASIRKYSLFYRAAFLLIVVSSSLPRRRDFLPGKEKHADHKRCFKKTPRLNANCTFSKHCATTLRHAPEVSCVEEVTFLACSILTYVFFWSSSPCPSSLQWNPRVPAYDE